MVYAFGIHQFSGTQWCKFYTSDVRPFPREEVPPSFSDPNSNTQNPETPAPKIRYPKFEARNPIPETWQAVREALTDLQVEGEALEVLLQVETLPPEPSALHPQPSILNPHPSTLNPQSEYPKSETRNTEHGTRNTGTNLSTTSSQKCAAVPKQARA